MAGAAIEDRENRIRNVAAALEQAYGPRPWRRHLPPVDELVATILSQHTSDANAERAFSTLRARFPTWESVIQASTDNVVTAIRSGGLANQKAPRIQAVLSALLRRYGSFDLNGLATMSVKEARAELVALPGVGPKTASCVLLFSLGMPAIPVDTHVHRVARRIGLIDEDLSAEGAHEELERLLAGDRDTVYAFHMHLIAHGRRVCLARRPACEQCGLTEFCDYARHARTAAS